MAKRLKNSGYNRGYKGHNKNKTILADDIYPLTKIEELNREKTYPLIIEDNFTVETLKIGECYYQAITDEFAMLNVEIFLQKHENVSLYVKGVRPIPRIIYSDKISNEERGTDVILQTENEEYYVTELTSSLLKDYYKAKIKNLK